VQEADKEHRVNHSKKYHKKLHNRSSCGMMLNNPRLNIW